MALQLTKTSSQASVLTGYKGISGSTARTICFWINGTYTSLDTLFYWGNNVSTQRWFVNEQTFSGSDNIQLSIFSAFKAWLKGNMFDGSWHFFVMTSADSSIANVNAFLDDAAMTVKSSGGASAINTGVVTDVTIADSPIAGWNFGDFDIFDFRIYNRVLSSGEQTTIFTNGNGCDGIISGLQTHLRFGTESGLLVQEIDLSGNGRDGFPVNGPSYIVDPFNSCSGFRLIDGGAKSPLIESNMIH